MLNSFPISLVVGSLLGALAGLGVGGGSLLILWLTLVLNMENTVAGTINLLFFIPSAIIASIFRWKQGALDVKKVFPAIVAACISAGVCAVLGRRLSLSLLKKIFGGLLIITGLRELFYRPRNAR